MGGLATAGLFRNDSYLFNMTQNQHSHIDVSGTDLVVRQVPLNDRTPTGAQIAAACGFAPSQQITVLHWQSDGNFEDVRPEEVADIAGKGARFIVLESDASYRLTIDGRRIDWPARQITGATLRTLGRVPVGKSIYFAHQDQPDQLLTEEQVLDLSAGGVESFYSRQGMWVLNVQGVRLEFNAPTVEVSVALARAGFDINQGWHIYLKVVGQPKKEMSLTDVIDLRAPGIEKLRLVPKDVSNGETAQQPRYQFALQEVDEAFLDERFARWETIIENGQRWLLIHGFKVPHGYLQALVTIALEIPLTYPGAQIDMFFVYPALVTATGQTPAATEVQVNIIGSNFQRWSRHRGAGSPWKSDTDNVITHLALVESALLNEVS